MRRLRAVPLGDAFLFWLVIGLAGLGIAMVYSAGVLDVPSNVTPGIWRRQLLWFMIALVVMYFLVRVPVIWLEWAAQPFYALALVLLALALAIGKGAGTAASTSSWIGIGPFQIQPSEFAKIAVIMMLARVLGSWREAPRTMWDLWKPILIVLVPMGLVMLQPDLGSALVFGSILIASLFWAGTPLLTLFFLITPVVSLFFSISVWLWGVYLLALTAGLVWLFLQRKVWLSEAVTVWLLNAAAGAAAQPLWNSLKPYQKNRFMVFLDPSVDPRGAGYNLIQSQVAIGSGGLWGKGWLDGTQKRLAFLPEQHTDFIFSVVGEELGFFGVAAVLVAFGLIFWRLVRIAEKSSDPFASLVPFGLFGSWFAHVLINTGMVVGIMPITGIPLPFLSYGGSFLLVNLLAVGIVQRIAVEGGR